MGRSPVRGEDLLTAFRSEGNAGGPTSRGRIEHNAEAPDMRTKLPIRPRRLCEAGRIHLLLKRSPVRNLRPAGVPCRRVTGSRCETNC